MAKMMEALTEAGNLVKSFKDYHSSHVKKKNQNKKTKAKSPKK